MNRLPQVSDTREPEAAWKALFFAGATAALVAVLFFRRNCGAELTQFNGFGLFEVPKMPPGTADGWFMLFQKDRFVGLALFGLIDLINYALVGLIFLALYGALRRVRKSAMVVATAFAFVGIAVYFASNQAFSMLSLSDRYATATTDVQRAMFLAAGEALLAIHNPGAVHQGTGIYISLFLVLLAGLIISFVMLSSTVFKGATAYTGILANFFALGYFIALIFAPAIIWLPPTISAPFRIIWYFLISWRLFQLGAGAKMEKSGI